MYKIPSGGGVSIASARPREITFHIFCVIKVYHVQHLITQKVYKIEM